MSQPGSSRASSGKRKSSSVHRAERIKKLSRYGISMDLSDELEESAKERCESFLQGNRVPNHYPGYSPDKMPTVLQRAQNLNEGRLYRDVTPWLVPSAEHSYWNGEITLDYLVDEVQAEWTRCAPMGSTRPKPDLAIGLSPDDFDEEETRKLKSYSSLERPSFVTPNLCYPFFMVEAKTGEEGLNKADRQNAHSAGIAVNAIFELQRAAFEATAPERVTELFRKPLAFSVSHNGRQANLYAHFAVPSNAMTAGYTIQRSEIDMISFFRRNGADRYKPYNFTLNVYQTIGQEHRQRIKNALAALPLPSGLSFATSGFTLESESRDSSILEESASEVTEAAKFAGELQEARAQAKLLEQREELMERRMKQLEEQIRRQTPTRQDSPHEAVGK
ncbi:MAG: hypothetical protein L6R38_002250 [Xanthoria sp. 2 TBL-2021]|nr:MAG: hypothetical protein L6R38_002250 [Xanthoria sp. 2 TBL-2021]